MRRTVAQLLLLGNRLSAARPRVVERLGPRQSTAPDRAFFRLDEDAATGGEEQRDLAGLGDLDDALPEAHVIDAITDLEALARAIRARRFAEVCFDRRFVEPRRRRGRLLRLLRRTNCRRQFGVFGRAVRGLVTVITLALLALDLRDPAFSVLGNNYMPDVATLGTKCFDISSYSNSHEGRSIPARGPTCDKRKA